MAKFLFTATNVCVLFSATVYVRMLSSLACQRGTLDIHVLRRA